jgi:uncharacterized protein (DUF885 family)
MTDTITPTTPASSPAVALADEFVRHRAATDHAWSLWTGDLTHLEEWDDPRTDAEDALRARLAEFARRAATTPAADDRDRLLLETVAATAHALDRELVWRAELTWVNHASGLLPSILTFLPRYPLVTAEHGDRYLDKVRALPTFLGHWCDRLVAAAPAGIVPIGHLVAGTIALLDRQLAAPLATGPLGRQAPPVELDAAAAERWIAELHRLLDGVVTEAVARLRTTLQEHTLPAARPDDRPGLVHLPEGAAHYETLIGVHTTLPLTAADVHATGLAQVARLEEEYLELAGPLLGLDDVDAIYARLRDDPSLRYADAGALVADATAALAKAAGAMGDWFGRLPEAPCVASAIEQGSLAFYSPPARDGSKPGQFFFNTADPSMWGTFQLEATTYHEGIPGHHLQFSIAQELDGLHPLLGRYYVTAYGEGWGLYTERLADEMGLYSTPLDRVGMLAADSMRACRLVVDTGLHALGWSREEAIAYMSAHSPLSPVQVVGEIDRYIGHPGQAVSYMIGRLEIERLRADTERRLGDRFDIRGFHDVVLGSGSVTLPSLHRLVEAWDPAR